MRMKTLKRGANRRRNVLHSLDSSIERSTERGSISYSAFPSPPKAIPYSIPSPKRIVKIIPTKQNLKNGTSYNGEAGNNLDCNNQYLDNENKKQGLHINNNISSHSVLGSNINENLQLSITSKLQDNKTANESCKKLPQNNIEGITPIQTPTKRKDVAKISMPPCSSSTPFFSKFRQFSPSSISPISDNSDQEVIEKKEMRNKQQKCVTNKVTQKRVLKSTTKLVSPHKKKMVNSLSKALFIQKLSINNDAKINGETFDSRELKENDSEWNSHKELTMKLKSNKRKTTLHEFNDENAIGVSVRNNSIAIDLSHPKIGPNSENHDFINEENNDLAKLSCKDPNIAKPIMDKEDAMKNGNNPDSQDLPPICDIPKTKNSPGLNTVHKNTLMKRNLSKVARVQLAKCNTQETESKKYLVESKKSDGSSNKQNVRYRPGPKSHKKELAIVDSDNHESPNSVIGYVQCDVIEKKINDELESEISKHSLLCNNQNSKLREETINKVYDKAEDCAISTIPSHGPLNISVTLGANNVREVTFNKPLDYKPKPKSREITTRYPLVQNDKPSSNDTSKVLIELNKHPTQDIVSQIQQLPSSKKIITGLEVISNDTVNINISQLLEKRKLEPAAYISSKKLSNDEMTGNGSTSKNDESIKSNFSERLESLNDIKEISKNLIVNNMSNKSSGNSVRSALRSDPVLLEKYKDNLSKTLQKVIKKTNRKNIAKTHEYFTASTSRKRESKESADGTLRRKLYSQDVANKEPLVGNSNKKQLLNDILLMSRSESSVSNNVRKEDEQNLNESRNHVVKSIPEKIDEKRAKNKTVKNKKRKIKSPVMVRASKRTRMKPVPFWLDDCRVKYQYDGLAREVSEVPYQEPVLQLDKQKYVSIAKAGSKNTTRERKNKTAVSKNVKKVQKSKAKKDMQKSKKKEDNIHKGSDSSPNEIMHEEQTDECMFQPKNELGKRIMDNKDEPPKTKTRQNSKSKNAKKIDFDVDLPINAHLHVECEQGDASNSKNKNGYSHGSHTSPDDEHNKSEGNASNSANSKNKNSNKDGYALSSHTSLDEHTKSEGNASSSKKRGAKRTDLALDSQTNPNIESEDVSKQKSKLPGRKRGRPRAKEKSAKGRSQAEPNSCTDENSPMEVSTALHPNEICPKDMLGNLEIDQLPVISQSNGAADECNNDVERNVTLDRNMLTNGLCRTVDLPIGLTECYSRTPEVFNGFTDDISIACLLKSNSMLVQKMILKPMGQKQMQRSSKNDFYFAVHKGRVLVTIHTSQVESECGSVFFVPKGIRYKIENRTNEEACLFCFCHANQT